MPTKIEITCFTDLKGSTALAEQMGHQAFAPLLQEHLRLGESLAIRNYGKYVKNIGDAHMVRFEFVEHALAFASQLQQSCADRPGVAELSTPVRVSLFQGAVEPVGDDVFGSGVNQAARLQGVTQAGNVTINKDLFETMKKVYSEGVAEQYCTSIGQHELKGIEGQQLLYNFDWLKYAEAMPGASLASPLYDHLRQAGIEPSNFTELDLNHPGRVIWPVVPRDLATAIHRGQVELIRLLTLIGWQVTVLIADCGGDTEYLSTKMCTLRPFNVASSLT
ncbi:MAG: adenylate/guanylate cyclase domain-containing protein [Acidobacteriia bacterium]|nr:adenylate/guanylate cyclase domain-containing protein [Terriglobia bacterium]